MKFKSPSPNLLLARVVLAVAAQDAADRRDFIAGMQYFLGGGRSNNISSVEMEGSTFVEFDLRQYPLRMVSSALNTVERLVRNV